MSANRFFPAARRRIRGAGYIYLLWLSLGLWAPAQLRPAAATIIAMGDGSGNTTAPLDDPGWNNVGFLGGATGVYIGNRYVLTVAHVGAGTINLNGTNYAPDAGSVTRLKDNSGAFTDLVLFRLQSDPGLSSLALSATGPALDSPLLYIGNGRNRDPNRETFAVGSGTADGYRYAPGATKRWGTNKLAGFEADVDAGYGPVDSFYSSFSDPLNDPNATNYTAGGNPANEAMAAPGDSGGAVFFKRGGFWELTGITYGIEELKGKTNLEAGSPALFGEAIYNADIAAYHSQIAAITAVPEPSTLTLMALGVAGLLGRRRKSKSI